VTTSTFRGRQMPPLLHTLTDDVLSPSPARRMLAERRYRDLATYLERYMGEKLNCRVWVYPQGSYRLGTTLVNPATNEFDVDIVIAYDISRSDITKRELIRQMHGWLVHYYQQGHGGGELQPSEYDGSKRRAFTLTYPDDFHMDVLVVVLEKPHPTRCAGAAKLAPRPLPVLLAAHEPARLRGALRLGIGASADRVGQARGGRDRRASAHR
jgi:hypothetical protein